MAQAPPATPSEAPAPLKGLRRIAAALHHRDFRVLWFGACFSSIGTWMQSLAENWLVLSLTASAFYLGLDAFLQQLPIMLFTLIGGVVADRHDRRLTLMASQWVQLSTAAILAALVFFGVVEVWHILVLSFITGTAQAFGGPAYQSLIPSLVGKQDLTNAIALNSIQFNVARMLGPLLAGGTLAVLKRWGVADMTALAICFAFNALSFLAVILSLMSLHLKHLPAARTQNMFGELKQGIAYVQEQREHQGAHGAGRRDGVLRHPDADAAARVRARRVRVGRRRLQRAAVVFGRRRGRRRDGGGVARPLPAHGADDLARAGVLRRDHRARRVEPLALSELRAALRERRHADDRGVLPDVARAADRAQRNARARDEHLSGGVSRRHAARQPRERISRQREIGAESSWRSTAWRCWR